MISKQELYKKRDEIINNPFLSQSQKEAALKEINYAINSDYWIADRPKEFQDQVLREFEYTKKTQADSTKRKNQTTNIKKGQNTYVIQKGDTLSEIVADYNKKNNTKLNWKDVARQNNISNPNKVKVGQVIYFVNPNQDDLEIQRQIDDLILEEYTKSNPRVSVQRVVGKPFDPNDPMNDYKKILPNMVTVNPIEWYTSRSSFFNLFKSPKSKKSTQYISPISMQQGGSVNNIEQQVDQLINAAVQGNQEAVKQIEEIMKAAQQENANPQIVAIAQMIAQKLEKMKVQAKYGSKLSYIKRLKGCCPDGSIVEFDRNGKKICKCGSKVKKPKK